MNQFPQPGLTMNKIGENRVSGFVKHTLNAGDHTKAPSPPITYLTHGTFYLLPLSIY